jgi:hypothetical protein
MIPAILMWKPIPLSQTRPNRDQFRRLAVAGRVYPHMRIFEAACLHDNLFLSA